MITNTQFKPGQIWNHQIKNGQPRFYKVNRIENKKIYFQCGQCTHIEFVKSRKWSLHRPDAIRVGQKWQISFDKKILTVVSKSVKFNTNCADFGPNSPDGTFAFIEDMLHPNSSWTFHGEEEASETIQPTTETPAINEDPRTTTIKCVKNLVQSVSVFKTATQAGLLAHVENFRIQYQQEPDERTLGVVVHLIQEYEKNRGVGKLPSPESAKSAHNNPALLAYERARGCK